MTKKDEHQYIMFPLCFLKETFKNQEAGLNLIISFGIMNFATKQKYELTEVARQTMYAFYREQTQNLLPSKLYKLIKNEISIDEDYNGFSGSEFNPEDQVSELMEKFVKQPEIKNLAILFYQVRQTAKLLNLKLGCFKNTQNEYKRGSEILQSFESKYGSDCWASCKISMLFEFRDSQKDIDIFRAYLGIKSIIGQRDFNISHKSVILSRMFGCKSNAALKDFLKDKEIKKLYDKYSKRYWFEWILNELESRGFITKIGYKKWGIFISAKYQDKNSLAQAVIKNHKQKKLATLEKLARRAIQQHIQETAF